MTAKTPYVRWLEGELEDRRGVVRAGNKMAPACVRALELLERAYVRGPLEMYTPDEQVEIDRLIAQYRWCFS